MTRNARFLLAVLSGVLLALPWIPNFTGIISLFALVPLLLIEDQLQNLKHQNKFSLAIKYSTISFFIWNIISTYWIKNSDVVAAITVISLNTFVMSLTFGLFHITKEKFGRKIGNFSLIVYWLSFEYIFLHAHLTWPWLNLGNALAGNIELIQWYEYTGTLGGTLWILTSNIIITSLVKEYSLNKANKQLLYRCLLAVMLIVSPILISKQLFKHYKETGDSVKFVLIQPNFDPYEEKYILPQSFQLNRILDLAKSAIDQSTNYVIAPETSLSEPIWERNLGSDSSILEIKQFVKKHPQISFIIGASTLKKIEPEKKIPAIARFEPKGSYYYTAHNTALQIDTTNKIPLYYKSKLVSGVETMPLIGLFRFLGNFTLDFGGVQGSLGAQLERDVFTHPVIKTSIAPVICYESVFGEHVTEYINKGANIISIITNDGWWGDNPVYIHHLNYAQLRAVETRRSIARCANTGISAFINQKGQIIQQTTWWTKDVICNTIKANNQLTFYVKYGDYIGRIAVFISVLLILYTIVVSFIKKKSLIIK